MFVFRYIMVMNVVVVKRLGNAGMMYVICLGGKCDFGLFINFWLGFEVGFQVYVRWYKLVSGWQGR
jgi:hypothetical protein